MGLTVVINRDVASFVSPFPSTYTDAGVTSSVDRTAGAECFTPSCEKNI